MRAVAALLASACAVAAAPAAGSVVLQACSGDAASQGWALPARGGGAGALSSLPGGPPQPPVCLATVDCAPVPAGGGDVLLAACGDASRCGAGAPDQQWHYTPGGQLRARAGDGSQCLTLADVDGPAANLWPCAGQTHNDSTWEAGPAAALLTADGSAGRPQRCLARAPGAGSTAVLNASALGRRLYGVGGLAAIGGARLIWEYAEPVRGQILDLLFAPSGGTAFQVLKTEIEGDVDSSYGSGPSFQHTRGGPTSFARGLYLPWLLPAARARNPAIGTYALAWGMPGWVGNGSYLTAESLAYHMAYLEGVRSTYGLTFDLAGVHNERSWSREWVVALRAALDAAGMSATRVSVGDEDNGGCTDCPAAWGDDRITTAAARDPAFAAALGVIGLHSLSDLGTEFDWQAAGVDYINSENNDVDGPLIETADGSFPQWAPNAGSPLGPGLAWPLRFLVSYLTVRATGTIICPLSHAWTWGYGRHNHGTALFIQPWSGHYVLGAAFWTQAHFTQATRPGWHFLDGSASGSWSGPPGAAAGWLTYGTLVAPGLDDFSVIAINSDANATAELRFQLAGALNATFAGAALAAWTSNASALFVQAADVRIGASGAFSCALPPRSVLTLTTLRTLAHVEPPVAPRAPFPLPWAAAFAAQALDEPGHLLSDLFGAFYIADDPTGTRGRVLRQAVPASPGSNSWLGPADGVPYTSLPAPGTAWANANISVDVLLTAADVPSAPGAPVLAALCGRVPIWQPANYKPQNATPGLCLALAPSGAWELADTALGGSATVLAAGALPAPAAGAWHSLALAFADDAVEARIDGAVVAAAQGLRGSAGVAGLATRWHTAHFDALALAPSAGHGRTAGSWLHDILPGEAARANLTGWAGFALDLRAPGSRALSVAALGRFRTRGNSRAHALDVVDAATGKSVLPGGPAAVDLSAAGCPASDLLGFCYARLPAPVALPPGRVYYVVSEEADGGDAFLAMDDAAAATTHVHRDGSTLMSYEGPGAGAVTGRVSRAGAAGAWLLEPAIECMYGPLNLVLEGGR